MIEDQLVKWCNIQYETLDYIEKRMRSANRFVDAKDLQKALKIKRSTADSRLMRYAKKGWVKEQRVEGERKYVLKIEGLQRLQWLEHMQTRPSPAQFKKMLEKEGTELPDWILEMK